ncbi:MAG: Asp-tRNA(Asn)/Glu-tRNA(Gln) amidotransferase subunit GatC [Gemmatimonadota bacterium]
MAVTRADVIQVAGLARLHLDEGEVVALTQDLNSILAHVSALGSADVSGIEGVSSAAEWPAPLRDDVAGSDPLAIPPAYLSAYWQSGFFTVPTLPAHDRAPNE